MLSSLIAAMMVQATPAPCTDEAFREFDFWLGTWDVTTADGTLAGRNVITAEESGCLVVERWTSASGGTGQSYNFWDPNTEQWRQIWVSRGMLIDYAGGLNDAGEMVLRGTITYHAQPSAPRAFEGRWTPNDDGTVTQSFMQQNAETNAWEPWFTGTYTRVE